MPKLPEPPAAEDLATIPAEVSTWIPDDLLWRLYFRGGRHPTTWRTMRHFGPTGGRFDHHSPPPRLQERSVLYCAGGGVTTVAEVFQDARVVDRSRGAPWLVAFRVTRPVWLLDLRGRWPTRAGASMALASGPRPRAQRWARAIYRAYPDVEGVLYPSSMHANRDAIALWDRCRSAMPNRPEFHRRLDEPALLDPLKKAAVALGFGLI